MMLIFKRLLSLLLLPFFLGQCTNIKAMASQAVSRNTWIPRSSSSYGLHDLIISQEKDRVNMDQSENSDKDKPSNLIASLFTEYKNSFGNKCGNSARSLGAMPFWSGTNTMTFGNNDGKADLDAYQFGLGNIITDGTGIGGVIQLNPVVKYAGTDGVLYFTHDKEKNGLYVKTHVPLGAMIVSPNMTETPKAQPDGKLLFEQTSPDIKYAFTDYPTPYDRAKTLKESFIGGNPSLDSLAGNRPHIIRLRKGRIEACKRTEIKFGDVSGSIGYNRYMDKGFASLGAKVSFPTANAPVGDYMLEPIVGRAGAWGVGGEFSAFYQIWESDCQSKHLNISAQAELLTLRPGLRPSFRTFDLKQNGPGSKYLLVANYRQKYLQDSNCKVLADFDPFTVQPFANVGTLPVISKTNIEGSVSLMVDFGHNDWNFAVGAECWGRTKEKLCIDMCAATDMRLPNLNDYAVLGRQLSAYLIDGQNGELATYYCEPKAKINLSLPAVKLAGTTPSACSSTATAPGVSLVSGVTVIDESLLPDGIKDARLAKNRIPEKLSDALDICGAAAPSALAGKAFAKAGYTWTEHCYAPAVSAVAGVEMTRHGSVRVQMWTVALQGSLSF